MTGSALVIGYNSRVVACSARRAGWDVCSLGHHSDVDLLRCVKKHVYFEDQPDDLKQYLRQFDVDYYVLCSGFEDADVPASKVLGNDPKIAKNVVDKVWLAKKLDALGIPQPELFDHESVRYPCIAKPIIGGGGHKNFVVRDESMLPPEDEYFLQELVTGTPLSTCTFSTGSEAIAATVNEILVGKKWLGTDLPYNYCGNVTPYVTRFREEMCAISEKLIPELGLVGTNGIDFVIGRNGPKVLEVNPRFQGSVDAVELATGENVFQAHVDAINGKLRPFRIRQYGYRAILFAHRPIRVDIDLTSPTRADIPPQGTMYNRGDAVCTLLGKGRTRGEASAMVREDVRQVWKELAGPERLSGTGRDNR